MKKEKIIMLQPDLEYGTLDYKSLKKEEPCLSIWYSCKTKHDVVFVPDGCFEVLFLCEKGSAKALKLSKKEITDVKPDGLDIVGVRLEPEYILEINDEDMELLTEELGRIYNPDDRLLYIEERLKNKIHKLTAHPVVLQMIENIIDNAGRITVEEMAEQYRYTTRHVNKLFTDAVGIGPKNFSQFIRFQNALLEITDNPFRENSQFIENLTYSDQAHFQREFKKYMGITPRQFIRKYELYNT